jgi:hypothetical protein
MFRHITTAIVRRCLQEEVLTDASLQFVYTTTLYYIYTSWFFYTRSHVCMKPGYRGHCVPLVRGWGQRGGVVVHIKLLQTP